MNDYSVELKNPKWQKKRLEIFQRDSFYCRACLNNTEELNVHHLKYEYGKKPWECANEDLLTVCNTCHEMIHKGSIAICTNIGPMTLINDSGGQDISIEFHNNAIEWFNKR